MQSALVTKRLQLAELRLADHEFIATLVNTPEWIRFIGDRNVHSLEDAKVFIQNICDDPNKKYWVVKLSNRIPIGVVTFIKRDYLKHHDIGFAFLSQYTNQGYAYEAAVAVLKEVIKNPLHTHVLATTIHDNELSIKLLEKLGLHFEQEIKQANDVLSVYSASVGKLGLS